VNALFLLFSACMSVRAMFYVVVNGSGYFCEDEVSFELKKGDCLKSVIFLRFEVDRFNP